MTPEPLGPFVTRPVPIWAYHHKPIDGWLTSLHPSLIIPALACVCGGSSTTVLPNPLVHLHLCHCFSQPTKMLKTFPSKGHVTFGWECLGHLGWSGDVMAEVEVDARDSAGQWWMILHIHMQGWG